MVLLSLPIGDQQYFAVETFTPGPMVVASVMLLRY